jgi:NitT/TauT family transport system ATP-binding protein
VESSATSPAVELDAVGVRFDGYPAIEEISFSAPKGQFVAIVGPTGCGKSSILNLVAGLLGPTSGRVRTSGRGIGGVNSEAAYMFQQDALLPWKRVLDNVMLGPILRGARPEDAREEARRWIDRVGLSGFDDRYPHQLSGGQRKRAAMAQVLINKLPLLLMDEPFGALDVQTRALMESELLELWQELGATVLFVTHDLEEAISLSDRVLLLTAGPNSRLKADYPIDLPRPRNVMEARFTPGFSEIYEDIWSALRTEVLESHARTN